MLTFGQSQARCLLLFPGFEPRYVAVHIYSTDRRVVLITFAYSWQESKYTYFPKCQTIHLRMNLNARNVIVIEYFTLWYWSFYLKDLHTSSTTSHSSLSLSLSFFFLLQPVFKSVLGFSWTKQKGKWLTARFASLTHQFSEKEACRKEMVVVCIIECCHWSFWDYATMMNALI